jgi:hypothetical protein
MVELNMPFVTGVSATVGVSTASTCFTVSACSACASLLGPHELSTLVPIANKSMATADLFNF